MLSAFVDWVKGLFGSKGAMQIGKDNNAVSGSNSGDGSTVITAGRDVVVHGDLAAPKTEREEIVEWLRKNGFKELASHVLQQLLRLAQIVGNAEVEHWVRLELFGYGPEGGMKKGVDIVPEYRAVMGQYYDDYGRALRLPSHYHFVNSYRFRYGVAMLEEWSKKTEMQSIADSTFTELIEEEFKVKVTQFSFNPVGIVEIVSAIRNRAMDKFRELEK
jgi:AbiTii